MNSNTQASRYSSNQSFVPTPTSWYDLLKERAEGVGYTIVFTVLGTLRNPHAVVAKVEGFLDVTRAPYFSFEGKGPTKGEAYEDAAREAMRNAGL